MVVNRRVVDWLLERDQPWVRYNTLVDILGIERDSEDVKGALAEAMTTPPASKILGSLDQNGGFTDKVAARKWGEVAVKGGYVPKYRGAAWKLIFLSEIGADQFDPRVHALGEHILANAFDSTFNTFSIHIEAGGNSDYALIPCFMGNMVWALCRLGFADRPEVRSTFDWLVRYQKFEDGDWKPPTSFPYKGSRERCWGKHTCYWGITSMLRAMTVVPNWFWTPEAEEAKRRAIGFILAHRLLWSSHDHTRPITTKNTRPQRLTAPLTYYQDAVEITSAMLTLGTRGEEIDEAIEFVLAKRNGEGKWMLDNATGPLDAPFGVKGCESKWITFRALRMLKLARRLHLDRETQYPRSSETSILAAG